MSKTDNMAMQCMYVNVHPRYQGPWACGPIWGREDPGGPHIGPMSFAIWDELELAIGRPYEYDIWS